MNLQGIELVCPICKSDLDSKGHDPSALVCTACGREYPVLCGIPDLRVQPDPYISIEADRAKGIALAARIESLSFRDAVALYYSLTPQVTAAQAEQFTRGVLAAEARAVSALEGWEAASHAGPANCLADIGCGTAALLAVTAAQGHRCVGVDVAFRWLVMARKRLSEAGLDVPLVCAGGEALPFRGGTFDRLVLESVIEHSLDQPRMLGESYRVAASGAWLFVATPNRFSLGPDPHAGLWLGGLIPERVIARHVERQGGIPPIRRLLSAAGVRRALSAAGFSSVNVYLPALAAAQRAQLSGPSKAVAELYELLRNRIGTRELFVPLDRRSTLWRKGSPRHRVCYDPRRFTLRHRFDLGLPAFTRAWREPDGPSRRSFFVSVATKTQVSRQSLTARYLTLFGGEVTSKIAVMLAFAYLARILHPADFGRIELSLSVTMFFFIAVEWGLGPYSARIIAAEPHRAPQLLAQVILLRSLLAIPAFLMIVALSARYGMPGLGILAIYGLTVLLIPLYNQWIFQGLGRMRWVAAGTAARYVVFAALVFIMVRPGSDARLVPVAEVVGLIALVLLNVAGRYGRMSMRIDWRGSFAGAKVLFIEGWPLAASQLASVALWYFPEIWLGWRSRPEQVAWMAASLRVVLAIHTFVSLYFFNILPGLAAAFARSSEEGLELTDRSLTTSMWVGCLMAGAVTVLAPLITMTLYGAAFYQSTLLLQVGIWMVPIGWLAGHYRYVLIATGHQRLEFLAAGATAVVTVLLALLFIKRDSTAGLTAVLALIAGGLVNVLLSGLAMKRRLGTVAAPRGLLEPIALTIAAVALGLAVKPLVGALAATVLIFGAYSILALRRDAELVRLWREWLPRWS